MSRLGVYDNWEKIVGAVMDRERLLQLALCDSFSSTSSTVATSSRLSFDYAAATSNELDQLAAPSSPRPPRNNVYTQANARGVAATIFAVPLAYYRRRMLREYDLFVSNYFSDHVPAHLLDQLERFSLHELQVGTDSFSKKNMIGRGGFSKVYKCRLADGSLVAVKRLKEDHIQSGEYMYRTEVKMKFNMSAHPNLLQLRGFCLTRKERMLVYPFLERPKSQPPLDWATRERIALGTAKGLAYLHEQCGQKIIHRDVMAANILLNVDFEPVVGDFGLVEFMEHEDAHGSRHFEPVICDFGLAKFMNHDDTHDTTAVRGTMGHVAPEYLNTGEVTEKTDVFASGVMLLELISGQKAFGLARLANDDNLMVLDWVKWLLREKKFQYYLVDVDLKGNCIDEDVEKLIQLSLLCAWGNPNKRPKMSDVVQMLQGRDGLAERWYEYLQEQELLPQESNYGPYHHNTDGSDCTLPLEMEVVNSISSLGDNHYECLNGKILPRSNLIFYRFSDLKKATKNFKSDMVLGEGSFGSVYMGWVDENSLMPSEFGSGILVAIKKLNPQSIRGFKEWQAFCHLKPLFAFSRTTIKLSGFGLAKIGPSRGESHVTTQVIGTYGYAAPEYVATGHLYVKSDVYGFGVVLLEIMTGLRAFDMSRPGRQDLVEWVKPLLSSEYKLDTIMDPRIEGQYSSKAVVLAAQLTLKCLELDPNNRPSMKEVGEVLEQIATFEKRRESRSSRSVHPSSPHQHRQSPRYAR